MSNVKPKVSVWDLEAEDGPVELTMWTVDAREAKKRAPDRYVDKLPRGMRPGPADDELKARASMRDEEAPDPHFGAAL